MNIDDYRAMVAQEEKQEDSNKEQPVVDEKVKDEEVVEGEVKTPPKEGEGEDVTQPDKVYVDGIGEVTLDDIKEWHKGNLRQSDYTKKTQELANQRKEAEKAIQLYDYLQSNPHIAQAMLQTEGANKDTLKVVDPVESKYSKLEQTVYDLMLQLEIRDLSAKYDDFEAQEVLDVAYNRNISNLEDAYKIVVSEKVKNTPEQQVDIEALKAEIRADLEKELKSQTDTSTIISSKDSIAPSNIDEPDLTPDEKKVAQMMKLSPEEYVKWRDTTKKR